MSFLAFICYALLPDIQGLLTRCAKAA